MVENCILDIKHLTVSYRRGSQTLIAVDDVSFQVFPGDILGIVGESGSGKSTIAKTIMLLNKNKYTNYQSGKILFHQENILDMNDKTIEKIRGKRIAMIFQNASTALNPVYTIGQQISEMIRIHQNCSKKDLERRVIHLLNEVKLTHPESRLKQYPHELSGGMQQRVMIAMALACQPEVVIADEPTTALDVTTQAEILKLLLSLQKKFGLTILFISHDMGVIAQICNRVLVMYKGKLVEKGKTEDLFCNPYHPYTKALLASIPNVNERVKRLKTLSDFGIEANER
ncbi:oligopeptide transport system ATP-binding protein [Ignavigranum ruoffiae]|uniref:Oligopeptide transport system ATP-binding protein n=1 Tax=Ignavigranum ruoffiae TaxID=89093 RepID=A0A1H9B5P2_9LACT|nr:ABC transporter ATP-binding protein [Ignavigranum ruoffiae]SEP84037.1 oligopeptide transport system ATP-binding protein [Ignavigranum ruoffiae]